MTKFWIIAAGLIGLALLFVLPPLFFRRGRTEDLDQNALNLAVFQRQLQELEADLVVGELEKQQYKSARRDLERELLSDTGGTGTDDRRDAGSERWAAALLGVAVPLVAVVLYLWLGNDAIIPRLEAAASGQAPAAHPGKGGEMPPLEVMIQRLADKLEQNPENLEGWMMLGRTYFAIGQPERALYAMEQAYGLAPENPDVLVTYAEALASGNDGMLVGRPAELIQTALKIDPKHTKARWLAGIVSFQRAEYSQAAEQWEALVTSFDPQSEDAQELQRSIAEARTRAGVGPEQEMETTGAADATDVEEKTTPPPATKAEVTVEVSLAESLQSKANASDSLFVYAKAVSGPPMPLAAHRARVADLPLTLTLDDSMAVIPAMKLSGFDEVTVGARISKSGQGTPQSGDLEGEVSPVQPGQAETVKILIGRVRP